jgi:hypothetical protein
MSATLESEVEVPVAMESSPDVLRFCFTDVDVGADVDIGTGLLLSSPVLEWSLEDLILVVGMEAYRTSR